MPPWAAAGWGVMLRHSFGDVAAPLSLSLSGAPRRLRDDEWVLARAAGCPAHIYRPSPCEGLRVLEGNRTQTKKASAGHLPSGFEQAARVLPLSLSRNRRKQK